MMVTQGDSSSLFSVTVVSGHVIYCQRSVATLVLYCAVLKRGDLMPKIATFLSLLSLAPLFGVNPFDFLYLLRLHCELSEDLWFWLAIPVHG